MSLILTVTGDEKRDLFFANIDAVQNLRRCDVDVLFKQRIDSFHMLSAWKVL